MSSGLQELLDSCPVASEGGIQCVTIPVGLFRTEIEAARQLAEQRSELLEALRSTRGVLACALKSAAPDLFENDEDVSDHIQIKKIDAAIANATQQRNATGGEG